MGQPEPRRVLVACGTALATARTVAQAVEAALKEQGFEVVTEPCRASEVSGLAKETDLVLSTTPISDGLGVPVVQTLAFLTGIGKEAALQQIIKALEE